MRDQGCRVMPGVVCRRGCGIGPAIPPRTKINMGELTMRVVKETHVTWSTASNAGLIYGPLSRMAEKGSRASEA
jgi:hypothetical protein